MRCRSRSIFSIATPGRLIDQLDRGRADLSRVELLVLDEADRMLDMGFVEAVERIAKATPATRQTLLFSATLDGDIARLAKRLLREPKLISVDGARERHANIEQRLHFVDDRAHKDRLLDHLLRDTEHESGDRIHAPPSAMRISSRYRCKRRDTRPPRCTGT